MTKYNKNIQSNLTWEISPQTKKTKQVSNNEILSQTTVWLISYDQRFGKEESQESFKTSNQKLQQ